MPKLGTVVEACSTFAEQAGGDVLEGCFERRRARYHPIVVVIEGACARLPTVGIGPHRIMKALEECLIVGFPLCDAWSVEDEGRWRARGEHRLWEAGRSENLVLVPTAHPLVPVVLEPACIILGQVLKSECSEDRIVAAPCIFVGEVGAQESAFTGVQFQPMLEE